MKYYKFLDSLRAIAIIPVVFYHCDKISYKSGFLGVDIFFVISGFLITLIILNDFKNNQFSFSKFLERRLRRIFPLLVTVSSITLIVSWFIMFPIEFRDFGQSIVSLFLFQSNYLFMKETSYFSNLSEIKPLLHTWSISVELQFYILFPLLLIFYFKRLKKFNLLLLLVFITSISFISYFIFSKYFPVYNFYSFTSRIWEFGFGVIAAYLVLSKTFKKNNFISSFGLILIFISFLIYNSEFSSFNYSLIIIVFGTTLVLIFFDEKRQTSLLLNNKILIEIGKISYGLYLWHFPIIIMFKIYQMQVGTNYLSLSQSLSLFFIVLVISFLSKRFIEDPFRKKNPSKKLKNDFKIKKFIKYWASVSLFFISTGALISAFLFTFTYWNIASTKNEKNFYSLIKKTQVFLQNFETNKKCKKNYSSIKEIDLKNLEYCNNKFGKGVLIIGDSHAEDIIGSLFYLNKEPFIIGLSRPTCRPANKGESKNCFYDKLNNFIINNDYFEKFLFHQSGAYFLQENKIFFKKNGRSIINTKNENNPLPLFQIDKKKIDSTIQYLEDINYNGYNIFWIGPRIEPHISFRKILKKGCKANITLRENLVQNFENLDLYLNNIIKINNNNKIKYISLIDLVKFDVSKDFMQCDKIYWIDGDHWSEEGEKYFGQRLKDL
jgi:peptidoglycan/LPS O-acetylase OafA/YrhL